MIYFVQATRSGMVKIGFSEDVNKRVSQLRVASPEPLRCIAIIEGTREDEARLNDHPREMAAKLEEADS